VKAVIKTVTVKTVTAVIKVARVKTVMVKMVSLATSPVTSPATRVRAKVATMTRVVTLSLQALSKTS
jgi:hypothetical protein